VTENYYLLRPFAAPVDNALAGTYVGNRSTARSGPIASFYVDETTKQRKLFVFCFAWSYLWIDLARMCGSVYRPMPGLCFLTREDVKLHAILIIYLVIFL
jgi:hypothetical protein